ncbi:tRNA (guanosine(46)-N7)-methyltransferase TrmB [Aurantibacillus circumpalustris]|uniref:tRNA (guanosine(46)-N7)-methyltransferase TrmB n=1 Tax=Aurantibacillus circumpalustris TaxID=3036359 RepID=UPI00295A6091|nr:tRNA (guanosine(46)-N7)-methyltransferase TrmB [Aurantibacillus circumpalustris]
MPTKLEKFAEFETFKNCFTLFFENLSQGFNLKGKWRTDYFKNDHPIILELGCGKGEYTIGLAQNNLNKNYIGVDIKGNRIWTGAKQAIENKLNNVGFMRTRIDFIDYCFDENEVDEIWITFPDPQPQSTRKRARLTHPLFLNRYKKLLKKDGTVHLKTDSTSFYEYTLEVIEENKLPLIWHTNNLYKNCPADRQELIAIKTYYEKMFTEKGEDIKYVCFKLN